MKRVLSYAFALVITSAALAYALWGADVMRLGRLLSGGNYWMLLPFMVALVLTYAVNAMRWAVIMRPLGRFPWRELVPSMMIGYAANNIFPARLGEFARAVLFARQFRQPVSGALASLVLERILDVAAIMVYYGVAVLLLGPPSESIGIAMQVVGWVLGAGCLFVVVLVTWPGAILRVWTVCTRWLPEPLAVRGRSILGHSITALSVIRSPATLANLMLLSLLRWVFVIALVQLSMVAYGIPLLGGLSLLVFVVASIAVALPGTPGYVGTLQAAFVFTLVPFGIERESALAASVMFLVANWLPATACGVMYFLMRGLHVADVRRDLETSRTSLTDP